MCLLLLTILSDGIIDKKSKKKNAKSYWILVLTIIEEIL